MKELAKNRGLTIVKIYKESKSAKLPANRPLFAEMLQYIKMGKADGILCWHINRLSRNPIDSAEIGWLLQNSIIKSIQTIDREYRPEDNALLFNIETSEATQFIRDLKKNTIRGLNSKVAKGWCPYRAPAGYMNDVINKNIVKDPEKFIVIKKMWDLVAANVYSPLQILNILNNEWGYLSRKTKSAGGNPMAQSEFYRILNNPFYYGYFKYNGELHKGEHDPMITIEQFERVQQILGNKIKARKRVHAFSFTGIITCGTCGCQITAEEKTKFVKNENTYKSYSYYRCTHRKTDTNCTEQPVTLP
jgi:DNA invertase Pin-like site-specific DNA recombinase